MKRLTTLSITLIALVLTSELATAQRGGGRSGSPAGPPPMSERGQMQTHSNRPTRESSEPGSVNREQQTTKMTASDRLEKNTHLATQLKGLFPPDTDLQLASSGFKNLGQFVAAAHVSKNLGVPFDQLKAKMLGTSTTAGKSGDSPVSLGKAIKELRPEADATSEVKKAERQAKEEIKQSEASRKKVEES